MKKKDRNHFQKHTFTSSEPPWAVEILIDATKGGLLNKIILLRVESPQLALRVHQLIL